jgi:uncharacterized membrane protein
MNDTDAATRRDAYLQRLDAAISGLPHGVAAEIRAGIAEELTGLDDAALAARIADLGDPEQIAHEAREELPAGSASAAPPAPPAPSASAALAVPPAPSASAALAVPPAPAAVASPSVTATRGFAIAAALTLGFGGLFVPGLGWVVGAVLVLFSTLWRGWEKAVAILVPLVAGGVSAVSALALWLMPATAINSSGPGAGEVVDPLVPAGYDVMWVVATIIGLLLIPASGLWLLWRMRGRGVS